MEAKTAVRASGQSRKRGPLQALCAAVALLVPCDLVAQEFYEPFPDSAGGGLPDGWSVISVDDAVAVESPTLEFAGLKAASGGRLQFTIDSAPKAAVACQSPALAGGPPAALYYSFLLQVDKTGKLDAEGGHSGLVMLADRAAGKAVGGKAQAAVGIKADGSGGYLLTIASDHAGPKGKSTHVDRVLEAGQPHFVVVAFENVAGQGTARLWVNPPPGAEEPEPTTIAEPDTHVAKTLDCVFIGSQSSAKALPEAFSIDEIRVGASWSEVAPTN